MPDLQQLTDTIAEVASKAVTLLKTHPLNHYSEITERADCLRLLRAAIELTPTLPPPLLK